MNTPRGWLIYATIALWTPLLLSWLHLIAPPLLAALTMACLGLSLVLFWAGVVSLLKKRLKVGDALWMLLYGVGALLYRGLITALSVAAKTG